MRRCEIQLVPATNRVTQHAALRSQQRGIRPADRDLVFLLGDLEEPAGSGCYKLSLSRPALKCLQSEGRISASQAERCRRLTLVTDGNEIITNYRR
jgi:hypothetical protein